MTNVDDVPAYGVIDYYCGEQGREYFAWQGRDGIKQALYNKHFWEPHIAPGDDVLDFGCGGGFLLNVLSARRKVGVEINPHALEVARRLGLEVYGTVMEVPGVFDKIISSHVLEHVPHPRQAVLELSHKLRDGRSRLMLLLPLDDWRSRRNRHYRSGDVNMHLYGWTPLLLGNLLNSCGLRVEQVRVIAHAWPPRSALLWSLSPWLFHTVAVCWSVLTKQRQLFAVARLNV